MVSATRMFFRLGVWMFLIPLFFGLVIGWLAVSDIRKAAMLDGAVGEGVARITALYVGGDTGSTQGRDTSHAYSVIYEFEVDGTPYKGDQGITEEFYRGLGVGDLVTVHYAPSDPRFSEIERGVAETGAVWISIVAIAFLAVAALLAWWRFGLLASARRAARSGESRQAKVDEVKPAQSRFGSGPRVQIVWRRAKRGQQRSRRIGKNLADRWPAGSTIPVWTDPKTGREWSEADLA